MTAAAPANSPVFSDSEPAEGTGRSLFGRFDLLYPAPSSGAGEAFFVRDRFPPTSLGSGRHTVINFIDSTQTDPLPLRLFQATARAVMRLDHPGIIKAYEAAEVDGIFYYLSEWPAQSETLADLISRSGWLDIQSSPASDTLCQVLRALAHAHTRGIFHLALNPEAILLEPGGHVLVSGFGLTAQDAQGPLLTELTSRLQPDYVSPEQLRGGPVSFHSDLYSLGIVMYEMLTDRTPSMKSGGLRRWGAYPAMPPNLLVPSLPEAVSNTTLMLLADDPADRYLPVDELQMLLESFRRQPGIDHDQAAGLEPVASSELSGDLPPVGIPGTDDTPHPMESCQNFDLMGIDAGDLKAPELSPDLSLANGEYSPETLSPWIEPQSTGDVLELGDLAPYPPPAVEPQGANPELAGPVMAESALAIPEAKEQPADSSQVVERPEKDPYEPPLIAQVNPPNRSQRTRKAPDSEGLPSNQGDEDLPARRERDYLPGEPGKEDLPEPPRHEDFPGQSQPKPLRTIAHNEGLAARSEVADTATLPAKYPVERPRRQPTIDYKDFLPRAASAGSIEKDLRKSHPAIRPLPFPTPKFSLVGQRSALQKAAMLIFALALLAGAGYVGFAVWGGTKPAAVDQAASVSNNAPATTGSSQGASQDAAASPQVLSPEPRVSTVPSPPQPLSPAVTTPEHNVHRSSANDGSRWHSSKSDRHRYSYHRWNGRRGYAYEQDQPLLPPKRQAPNFY